MGWDAHSSAVVSWNLREPRIKHPELREAFERACEFVVLKSSTCDMLLKLGSLDCSDCREMLIEATGKSCYDDWSKEQVQEISKRANWDFEVDKDQLWAYWSARKFLEVCAQFKLSINFSY